MEPEKIIEEQFNSLPPEIKEAIGRVPWKERVRDIAKRESLNDDQALALEAETMIILYGFLPPEGYVQSIETEVGVDEEQAERVAKLVTNEIFDDIERQFETIEASASNSSPTSPAPTSTSSIAVKIPQPSFPMVEKGEVAHDTTPQEKAWMEEGVEPLPKQEPEGNSSAVSSKQYVAGENSPKNIVEEKLKNMTSSSYKKGEDPYREPI